MDDDKIWKTHDPLFLDFTPFKIEKPRWDENNCLWDYSAFKNSQMTGMVPLEVVFRFGLPKGSSFRKRLKNKGYLESLFQGVPKDSSEGFIEELREGVHDGKLWDFPIIEFSTKWEPEDRFMTYKEAQEISGLSDSEWSTFIEWNRLVAVQLKSFFEKFNLVLWDGKCEWGNCLIKRPFRAKKFCFSG